MRPLVHPARWPRLQNSPAQSSRVRFDILTQLCDLFATELECGAPETEAQLPQRPAVFLQAPQSSVLYDRDAAQSPVPSPLLDISTLFRPLAARSPPDPLLSRHFAHSFAPPL